MARPTGDYAGISQTPDRARQRVGSFPLGVERSIAWLHQFRRLRQRYERNSEIHEALVALAAILINLNFL